MYLKAYLLMKSKLLKIGKQYFEGITSLIFPHFCVVCGSELNQKTEHLCFSCEEELHYTYFEKYEDYSIADQVFWGRLNIENVFALLYYEAGTSTKKILHHIKYSEGVDLAHFMGKMLARKLKNNPKFADIEVLLPVPIHSKKKFSRGYNQSLLIAKGVSEELGIPILDVLYRKRHDKSQTRKSKEERYENVKDKFALKKGALLGVKHVMIIDDVLTTGATLEFAARAVFEDDKNVKVSLGTLAVAH
ncbi:amidophosphoribosyltransferase [Brumimicrobium oceani]|uniref:Amidophosphoribosyltransferase n=2 Tax=Brumimicrobium oceani TaxID=2100725 RepID=A0A2U2XBC0_9FLAO|nr:amidophosphoribosyltransferase [Brumimicrobium oceani]